jgi:hypothetical protein
VPLRGYTPGRVAMESTLLWLLFPQVVLGVWFGVRILIALRSGEKPSIHVWGPFVIAVTGVLGGVSFLEEDMPHIMRGPPAIVTSPGSIKVRASLMETFKNLSPASIAFNAPEEMNLEETAGIELLLSLTAPVETLKKQLTEAGKAHGDQIRAGTQMEATLRPARKEAFEVLAVQPELQTLHPVKTTRWTWRVTPLEGGRQELHLVVSAPSLPSEKSRAPLSMVNYKHTIVVNVTPWKHVTRFGKNNWQWLWTALLIPAAGLVWKRLRRKRVEVPK